MEIPDTSFLEIQSEIRAPSSLQRVQLLLPLPLPLLLANSIVAWMERKRGNMTLVMIESQEE